MAHHQQFSRGQHPFRQRRVKRFLYGIGTLLVSTCLIHPGASAEQWMHWRGADQNGVASGEGFPTQWSESEGIVWRVDIPGSGSSTPVVVGNRALLTSGVDGQNRLLCIDTDTGSTLWSAKLGTDRGAKHRKGSGANPSAVTDGVLTFAYFRSGDLGCVDADGNVRWQKNLQDAYGEDTLWWDLGTSPILTDKAVIVAVLHSGPSFLAAFDKRNGQLLWRTERVTDAPEESAQAYTTPVAVTIGETRAIAVMGADHLTLHSEEDGRELARLGGFNPSGQRFFRSIASPVVSGDIIVCPYARGETLTGVKLSALLAGEGEKAIAWFRDDIGSDVPTPASRDGKIYVCGDKGEVSALDAETGETLWKVDLPRNRATYSSSPLLAGDYLYLTREDTVTFVVGPLSAEQPKLVATNELDDEARNTVASLVPVGSDLLLRSRESLYRISGK